MVNELEKPSESEDVLDENIHPEVSNGCKYFSKMVNELSFMRE